MNPTLFSWDFWNARPAGAALPPKRSSIFKASDRRWYNQNRPDFRRGGFVWEVEHKIPARLRARATEIMWTKERCLSFDLARDNPEPCRRLEERVFSNTLTPLSCSTCPVANLVPPLGFRRLTHSPAGIYPAPISLSAGLYIFFTKLLCESTTLVMNSIKWWTVRISSPVNQLSFELFMRDAARVC